MKVVILPAHDTTSNVRCGDCWHDSVCVGYSCGAATLADFLPQNLEVFHAVGLWAGPGSKVKLLAEIETLT